MNLVIITTACLAVISMCTHTSARSTRATSCETQVADFCRQNADHCTRTMSCPACYYGPGSKHWNTAVSKCEEGFTPEGRSVKLVNTANSEDTPSADNSVRTSCAKEIRAWCRENAPQGCALTNQCPKCTKGENSNEFTQAVNDCVSKRNKQSETPVVPQEHTPTTTATKPPAAAPENSAYAVCAKKVDKWCKENSDCRLINQCPKCTKGKNSDEYKQAVDKCVSENTAQSAKAPNSITPQKNFAASTENVENSCAKEVDNWCREKAPQGCAINNGCPKCTRGPNSDEYKQVVAQCVANRNSKKENTQEKSIDPAQVATDVVAKSTCEKSLGKWCEENAPQGCALTSSCPMCTEGKSSQPWKDAVKICVANALQSASNEMPTPRARCVKEARDWCRKNAECGKTGSCDHCTKGEGSKEWEAKVAQCAL